MITEGWMNMKGGRFTADMSDIQTHAKDTNKGVHCPGCKTKLRLSDFKERKDDEGEVTNWTKKCDCGAEMTIFNENRKPTFKQFLLAEAKKPEFMNTMLDREIQRQHNAKKVGQPDDVKAKNAYSRGFRGAFGGRGADDTGISDAMIEHFKRGQKDGTAARKKAGEVPAPFITKNGYGEKKPNQAFEKMVKAAMAEYQKVSEAKGDMVKPHKYSVKVLEKGKTGKFPSLKGEIYEKDVLIGRFSRAATKDGFVPPIVSKFLSTQAKARFEDFSDSLSIEETIEALLP